MKIVYTRTLSLSLFAEKKTLAGLTKKKKQENLVKYLDSKDVKEVKACLCVLRDVKELKNVELVLSKLLVLTVRV